MNTPKLRALTLHPEWAWASCYLGKGDENRPERVAKMVLNVIGDGWLAIHAGKHIGGKPGLGATWDGMVELANAAKRAGCLPLALAPSPKAIPKSAIVALTRVGPGNPTSRWAVPGQAQIALRDLFVLPEPVPCSGKQGLWTVSDEVAVKVFAQLPKQEKS